MTSDAAVTTARAILADLQAAVDSRDIDRLDDLFDERAVLLGTSAHNLDRDDVRAYLKLVAEQPGRLSWEFRDVRVFHEVDATLGFAAIGDVVVSEDGEEARAPFRLTVLAVETDRGWRLRQFHGSIPTGV